MNRYFINDFGMINALGSDKTVIFKNWLSNISPGLTHGEEFFPGHPCYVAKVLSELPKVPANLQKYHCRNNELLIAAYQQIEATVERFTKQFGKHRIGIVLGTSTSGISAAEKALSEKVQTGSTPEYYHFKQQDIGAGSDFFSAYTGITGPSLTVSTACSSSANAFNTARRLMELDICDAVIVGGADSLCQMTVQGFSALESVSPDICQPFSKNRNGITIGEAAALFVFSKQPANIELYGIACSSDAHHISAPDPSGKGACITMQAAFAQSPFALAQLDYLNLHGTATKLNDAMESTAVSSVFGNSVLCSSTKSLTGHTLGAAAATELGLCCLLLSENNIDKTIPAQAWDQQFDPELPALNIADGIKKPASLKLCLSNSFAFGGNNISLLVGHAHETF
jgi:3-oxoacyl-[acyl-carrier-protein] synthase I